MEQEKISLSTLIKKIISYGISGIMIAGGVAIILAHFFNYFPTEFPSWPILGSGWGLIGTGFIIYIVDSILGYMRLKNKCSKEVKE